MRISGVVCDGGRSARRASIVFPWSPDVEKGARPLR